MPSPVPYREVLRLLKSKGWVLDRVKGSHHIFIKQGHANLIIPVHSNKVKYGYYKEAEQA